MCRISELQNAVKDLQTRHDIEQQERKTAEKQSTIRFVYPTFIFCDDNNNR